MKNNAIIAVNLFLILLLTIIGIKSFERYQENLIKQQMIQEAQRLKNKAFKVVNAEHLKCLANNIYHEAGGEPFMGQVAVARVVMNRIKYGFASNPCTVIYQKTNIPDLNNSNGIRIICQFNWVCENKQPPSNNNPIYKQAEQIAYKVLSENKWHEQFPNILFFHNTSVSPNWTYKKIIEIGDHVFYSKEKHINKDN